MRTTLNLNDDLVKAAAKMSSIKEKTALIHAGLRALCQIEAQRSLAEAGGSAQQLVAPPRRRPKK